MYDRCGQCSAALSNLLHYSCEDGIHFKSVNSKSSKSGLLVNSNPSLTIRSIHEEKVDITWNRGVARLNCFLFSNIASLDVHEDMPL